MWLLQEALVHWVEQPARKESTVQLLPRSQLKGRTVVKAPCLPSRFAMQNLWCTVAACIPESLFFQVAQHGDREETYFSENSHTLATGKGPSSAHLVRPGLMVFIVMGWLLSLRYLHGLTLNKRGFRAISAWWDILDAEMLLDS